MGVARILGIDRRNIKKRMMLDISGNVFWTDYRRGKCIDVLLKHHVELVIKWWKIETTISQTERMSQG